MLFPRGVSTQHHIVLSYSFFTRLLYFLQQTAPHTQVQIASATKCTSLRYRLHLQQTAPHTQVQIGSDNLLCCPTEIEVADKTCHLTHSMLTQVRAVLSLTPCQLSGSAGTTTQYADTGQSCPVTNPMSAIWQCRHHHTVC